MVAPSYVGCNAGIGYPAAGVLQPCGAVEELCSELDRALVYHALMREQSPAVGNPVLAEAIAGHERMVGTWAILPPQTGELGDSGTFFAAMAEANAGALWAFPEEHRYVLAGRRRIT